MPHLKFKEVAAGKILGIVVACKILVSFSVFALHAAFDIYALALDNFRNCPECGECGLEARFELIQVLL